MSCSSASQRKPDILIIDHDMTLVSEAPAHHVLNFGRRIADGESMAVLRHPMSFRLSRNRIMPLLQINDLIVCTRDRSARGVSISVDEGRCHAARRQRPANRPRCARSRPRQAGGGEILFDGKSIAGLGPETIVRLGIPCAGGAGVPASRKKNHARRVESAHRESALSREADAMFDLFPDIRSFSNALGWTLSGGQLQMVAVARG